MVPHAGNTFFLPSALPFYRLLQIAMLNDTSGNLIQITALDRGK